ATVWTTTATEQSMTAATRCATLGCAKPSRCATGRAAASPCAIPTPAPAAHRPVEITMGTRLVGVLIALALAPPAHAQVNDHLKCCKVKAHGRTKGLVDLVPPLGP